MRFFPAAVSWQRPHCCLNAFCPASTFWARTGSATSRIPAVATVSAIRDRRMAELRMAGKGIGKSTSASLWARGELRAQVFADHDRHRLVHFRVVEGICDRRTSEGDDVCLVRLL